MIAYMTTPEAAVLVVGHDISGQATEERLASIWPTHDWLPACRTLLLVRCLRMAIASRAGTDRGFAYLVGVAIYQAHGETGCQIAGAADKRDVSRERNTGKARCIIYNHLSFNSGGADWDKWEAAMFEARCAMANSCCTTKPHRRCQYAPGSWALRH
ncbi:hypothetical protein FQR65_LT20279 [Abscondita terminalis]|nr:hypothetical protein FQR65_LT20279 [Abscondita terminalis]